MKVARSHGFATIATLLLGAVLVAAASFAPGVEVALLPASLGEVSGLAQSREHPDIFWMHNDSGDLPRVYAVNRSGTLVGTYTLAGAIAIDWEDMAIGPAPDGRSYLYFADIGDNDGQRASVRVYRVEEPRVAADQAPVVTTISGVTAYEFVYEDGPRDAEGFMVDPITGDFYIVSKREPDGNHLYRSRSASETGRNRLTRVGTFSFTGTTGADISPDGLQVLIRRYSSAINAATPPETAASYWSRPDASLNLPDLLAEPAQIVPLVVETQGEAIAFAADGLGFFTTSEHGSLPGATTTQAPLTFYAALPGR